MHSSELIRISTAARMVGHHQSAVHRALKRKHDRIPSYPTADGLPLVLLEDVRRWADTARPGQPRKT